MGFVRRPVFIYQLMRNFAKKLIMNERWLLHTSAERLSCGAVTLIAPHGLTLLKQKVYAVVGKNGSGKTTLADVLAKGRTSERNGITTYKDKDFRVRRIEFSDIHSLSGCKDSYYQQRFEATMNEDIPTVAELLEGRISRERWTLLSNRLSLHDIEEKKINYLSSGELRKFLVVSQLAELPDLLILDNPYIGLDTPSRTLLNDLLQSLTTEGVTVMLLLCNPKDIPPFTYGTIAMRELTIGEVVTGDKMRMRDSVESLFDERQIAMLPEGTTADETHFSVSFRLKDCRVAYGATTILEHVDWEVKRGEKWALLGENGAGKSMLLSLVCADNPQSYSNDITIFDRRRGTGESIWDIKKRIGYLSPEMHLYFREAKDTLEVVASGLREIAGFFAPISKEQLQKAQSWMDAFGISHLGRRRFPTLSSGEQRLVLLVRTLIKRPPLLVLDEPLHGLDKTAKAMALDAIERIAEADGTTLIYVTHYEEEIPPCVNRRKILKKLKSQ